MKTKMNFKQIAAILLLLVAGTTASFAQILATDGENDTIAVGSKAHYKVDLYFPGTINNPAVFDSSGVIWTFPAGYAVADFFRIDGVSALTINRWGTYTTHSEPAGVYDQNEITMNAKAITGASLVLSAQERSRPLIGVGCIAGNTTTKNIDIVAMPTIPSYGADSGSCAAPANLLVPVNFTGYGYYDVTLHIAAFDLLNAPIGAPQNLDLAGQLHVRTKEVAVLHRLNIPNATLAAACPASTIPATGCYFVITATDLQDRISKKTLSYNWAAHTGEVANANPDLANQYRFFVYPIPTTQPIQHIQNNY